jgi:iron complex transport system ATP-binding protein
LWLDDPLDAIDSLHQHRLLQWLKETARTRQTTLVTATDHAMVRVYADHSILLAGGTLIAEGPPQAALRSHYLTRAFGDSLQDSKSPQ